MIGEPTFETTLHRVSLGLWALAGVLILSAIGVWTWRRP